MLMAEPIADLSSASRGRCLLQFSFDQGWADAFSPSADHWSDHAIGRSIRRFAPKPRGSRPSIAAFARWANEDRRLVLGQTVSIHGPLSMDADNV
jgi:tRNA U34 5-methylaminomethyl-2-thiouridine-forming methyltransferase MnmC